MVRPATKDDIDNILEMGTGFFNYAIQDKYLMYDKESFRAYIEFLIGQTFTTVLVSEDNGRITGTIAGILSPWFMDFSQKILTEQWWWVCPENRKNSSAFDLLDGLVEWGKENGASRLIMVSISSKKEESVKKYYARKGFKYMETHYIKEIS